MQKRNNIPGSVATGSPRESGVLFAPFSSIRSEQLGHSRHSPDNSFHLAAEFRKFSELNFSVVKETVPRDEN
jgi:hypothetical protein